MRLRLNLRGRNRFVLLTSRHALKFPSLRWAPGVQVESKPDSWGLYNGRLVAVDYGWQG